MSLLLFAAALTVAQPAPSAQPPTEVAPVVVTLPDPRRAARDLAACIARGCSPREDMTLTLRSAEASFLAGDYAAARATLDASRRRNRKHGDTHPVLLAGVYKADHTVNRHLGRADEAHISARAAATLIAGHYGQDSPEALWARLDTADALLYARRTEAARARYEQLREITRERGPRNLRNVVALRLAWLPALAGQPESARVRLQRIIDEAGPSESALAMSAALLKLRLLPPEAQDAAAAQLIADFRKRAAGLPEPILLYSPSLDRSAEAAGAAAVGMLGQPPPSMPDPSDWIDVGFFIDSDGRVKEAQILRHGSESGRAKWREEALDLIRRRIYAPASDAEPGDQTYRIERVALTSRLGRPVTGSRLPVRSQVTHLHNTDLTRVTAGGEP